MFYIGCDPEFFAKKDGKFIPAHKLGVTDKTAKCGIQNDRSKYYDWSGTYFRDGYGIEFNTVGDHHCRALQISQINNLTQFVKEKYKVELVASSAIEIDLKDMKDAPKDVLSVGCDPAWNAYLEAQTTPPLDFRTHSMRYGAGHLHFMDYTDTYSKPKISIEKWTDPAFCMNIAKWFDLYIGLPLTLMLPDKTQFLRRKYFGLAGEFRLQKHTGQHGIEYRTPGAEIFGDYRLACLGWEAGRYVLENNAHVKFPKELEDDLQEIINLGPGKKILKAFQILNSVHYLYSPEVIRYIRVHKPLKTDMSWVKKYGSDFHTGWGEWVIKELPVKVINSIPGRGSHVRN